MDGNAEVVAEDCIWKEVLTPGTSRISKKPTEGSTCVLKIENVRCESAKEDSLLNSQYLTSLLERQRSLILTEDGEITLIIGEADCELDKRIERAVQLMKDHERARIKVSVPDPATNVESEKISFDATLMKHCAFKPIWEWTPEEKYEIAMKYKNIGVKLFKESESSAQRFKKSESSAQHFKDSESSAQRFKESESSAQRFKDAFYRFSRACKILITLEPIDDLELDKTLYDKIQTLRLKLYNNMAACQGKHHNYYHVIELCSKVLAKNDKNVLTLFRRGYAYGELKDYERAVNDFTTLLRIEPSNKQAISKLQHYRSCLRQANSHCNEMVKRMFKT